MSEGLEIAPPRVSVIIPTYNLGSLLPGAIESVVAQTLRDWELVVVDDCSTDDTREVVERFEADPRIRYVRQPTNRGPSAARNRGIAHSSGEFIAFLDADDRWLPTKLEKQVDSIVATGADVCCVDALNVFDGCRTVVSAKSEPFSGDELFVELLFRNSLPGSASAVMVRRRCFEVAGLWDEALRGGEDRDLWLRLTLRCRFSFVPEPLVRIDRMRDDRATVDWLRMARNREAYLKKWERELPVRFSPHLSALRRQSYDYIAKCHYRLENFRLARSYSLRAAFAGRRIDEPCRESFRLFAKSFVRSVRRQVRLDHTR